MAVIGFVAHPQRHSALDVVASTTAWLEGLGHEVRLLDPTDTGDPSVPGATKGIASPLDPAQLDGLDLAVSVGGDGTMLRTVDLVSPNKVPILGVNFGHLGYLAAVEPEGLREALGRFLDGDYQVEARMMLDIKVRTDGDRTELTSCSVLNDIVLQRAGQGHTVRAELAVNGVSFLRYVADSLIVATPTGSTAYNLSARGPIVSPRSRVQIVTPVAPHLLFDRSLVLACDESVALSPLDGLAANIVADGQPLGTLEPGQTLHCGQSTNDALLITFGDRDFHHILKRKFHLADHPEA
ncbi:MAG: NAD(+)/NADH kinase [Acidimicrobiales bacterium]